MSDTNAWEPTTEGHDQRRRVRRERKAGADSGSPGRRRAPRCALPVSPGACDLVVQWLPVRPPEQPAEPHFYIRGVPLATADGTVPATRPGSTCRLTSLRTSVGPAVRSPRPAILERSVCRFDAYAWRRIGAPGAAVARRRPVFLLHIRKTAGVVTPMKQYVNRLQRGAMPASGARDRTRGGTEWNRSTSSPDTWTSAQSHASPFVRP